MSTTPEERSEADPRSATRSRGRAYWVRTIAYWTFTIPVAWEMAAGSLWDLFQIEYVRVILTHLRYPLYMNPMLGLWKLGGAAAVIAPRFPRLKEWAYAGFFFNYYGAVASHVLVGDGPGQWTPPLMFLVFTIASWAVRPADRRLPSAKPTATVPPLAWAIPVGLLLLMLVVSYVTLPKGPPPGY